MPAGRAHSDNSTSPETSGNTPAPITSKENRSLKRFRAALAGDSGEANVYGIEGPHLVEEARRSGIEIEAVLASPAGEKHLELLGFTAASARPSATPRVLRTTDRLFTSIAATETPQGIAAIVRLPEYSFEDIVRGLPLVVVLVGVQDPGNVGTIVRSAEAFGATGIVAAGASASPYGPKAMRASAGSVFRLPMLLRAQPPVLLAQLRVAGVALVATRSGLSTEGPPPREPHTIDLRRPVALLIGGEAHGLPEPVLRSVDAAIRIPLAHPVESLNAAVAASVVLYEAARQRAATQET
ncbi:MAG: RNA methyltransferase [Acidobacteriota bacterium]|nr:RNA methyltransferase [Acidobacteriota bacterium]